MVPPQAGDALAGERPPVGVVVVVGVAGTPVVVVVVAVVVGAGVVGVEWVDVPAGQTRPPPLRISNF